jgi:rod shape-determining protein MreC
VLDAGGVFGQVARVGQLTSEVILLSDAAHAIPVQVNRNGLRTIAVGTGDTGRLKLPYLSTSADVVAGDLLVTSGLGGGFPAGYPVGTVIDVKRDPAASLADVDALPPTAPATSTPAPVAPAAAAAQPKPVPKPAPKPAAELPSGANDE